VLALIERRDGILKEATELKNAGQVWCVCVRERDTERERERDGILKEATELENAGQVCKIILYIYYYMYIIFIYIYI
jgi:hypothetical protein